MKYHVLGGKWTSTKSQLTEENSVDETDHGPMAADFQVLDDVFRRHFRRKLAALPQLCSTAVEGALQLVQEERDGKASGRCVLKTRWSPRTRMLTRMLMVQMSKHMVMQWRTIPFCNSLFEQSCTCFPCYQSAVWSGKCRVWSVK